MAGKNGGKVESFRLLAPEVEWIDRWVHASGQDRTKVLRASVKVLIMIGEHLTFEERVSIIAHFAATDVGEIKAEYKSVIGDAIGSLRLPADLAEKKARLVDAPKGEDP